jgi:hypothetical protein
VSARSTVHAGGFSCLQENGSAQPRRLLPPVYARIEKKRNRESGDTAVKSGAPFDPGECLHLEQVGLEDGGVGIMCPCSGCSASRDGEKAKSPAINWQGIGTKWNTIVFRKACRSLNLLVELVGIEPTTSSLRTMRSPS